MPSRFFTILILLFWAASSGWFFYVEFWPRIRGGDAPPFVIDLADEARRNSPPINWEIIRAGKVIGRLSTSINYHEEDDSFELNGRVTDLELSKASVEVTLMTNSYRVTREGKLLAVSADAQLKLLGGLQFRVLVDSVLTGQVFDTTLKIESQVFNKELKLAPVVLSNRGSALNPLHPVDRIRGLSPGRSWRIALVDPIHDALASLVPGGSPDVSYVQASVLPDVKILHWSGKDRECYVIEYTGDGINAHTWVMVSDGSVLRQEAKFHDEELILERTNP
jgi:hypothetical protein